jgi:hypothetical protein
MGELLFPTIPDERSTIIDTDISGEGVAVADRVR